MTFALMNIVEPYYDLDLSPGKAIDIWPGVGVNMNDRLLPRFSARTFPFQELQTLDVPSQDDLLQSSALVFESTDERSEASHLAVHFSASFGIVSAKAAFSKARSELEKKSIFYLMVRVEGEGISLQSWKWPEKPQAEDIASKEERMRQFLDDHGSHYIERVVLGQSIVVRAALASKVFTEVQKYRAAVSAVGGLWKAGGSINSEQEKILSSASSEVLAVIVSGGVEPPSAQYITGYSDLREVLAGLRNGSIRIESGPIRATAKSYWHTLKEYPKCRELFASFDQPEPILPIWGVPVGTILPWRPPEESLIRNEDGEVVEIVPPKGWALCTAQGAGPDLTDRFIKGVSDYVEVGAEGGSATHLHHFRELSGWEASGTTEGPEGADNYTGKPNWNHKHWVEGNTDPASSVPPNIGYVYIIKMGQSVEPIE